MVYGFLLNMWIMRRVDEAYLSLMVSMTPQRITQAEKEMIMATPQIPVAQ